MAAPSAVGLAAMEAIAARARRLQQEAAMRWLVKDELVFLLRHADVCAVPRCATVCQRPASGTLILYDQREVADFKKDGWKWQQRKDGSGRVREDRAKLVINRSVVILGTYVHSVEIQTFHRRSYHIRDADPPIVLVHYFDEGPKRLEEPAPFGESPSIPHHSRISQHAPRLCDQPELPVYDGLGPSSSTWFDSDDGANSSSLDTIMKDCLAMDALPQSSADPQQNVGMQEVMMNDAISPFDGGMFFPELAAYELSPSPKAERGLVAISDFSPDWDFIHGGAKILICLASALTSDSISAPLFVRFGSAEFVPAERVSDTVLRCTAPRASQAGSVEFCICSTVRADSKNLSTTRCFHYRNPLPLPLDSTSWQSEALFGVEANGLVGGCMGKRGRSPRLSMFDSSLRSPFGSNVDASCLSTFADTSLDERQCKIRVVERLSEVHNVIRTTTGQGSPLRSAVHLSASLNDRDVATNDGENTDSLTGQVPRLLVSAHGSLSMDDDEFEALSDQELEQLSEQLLDRVVRQLVSLAHASDELLEELNSLDETGLSLLHYMSFYNCAHLIPVLLAHGARVNQQSTHGHTPLHLAAGCGHEEAVQSLLLAGADPWCSDFDGLTPAERAFKSGHTLVAQHLESRMGTSPNRNGSISIDSDASNDGSVDDTQSQIPMDCSHCLVPTENDASPADTGYSTRRVRPAAFLGENEEHNRKLLLGALSTMSLHDRCALSLGISRDMSSSSGRRRGSSVDEDNSTVCSSLSVSAPTPSEAGPLSGTMTSEADSMCDAEVKSVLADDEQHMQRLEAAMELMGPEEIQSLEEEARVIQHNFRAWLLRRNCRKMHEATTRLHEAAQTIQVELQKREEDQLSEPAASMQSHISEQEQVQRERAAVTVQAAARTMLARKSFLQARNVTIKVQAATRGALCRKNFARMKTHALASLVIQRNVREWLSKHPSAGTSAKLPKISERTDEDTAGSEELVPRGILKDDDDSDEEEFTMVTTD